MERGNGDKTVGALTLKAGETSIQYSVSGRSEATLLHEWQEEEKLGRFFGKLLGEVAFIGAEKVEFKLNGENISGALIKEGRIVKSLAVKPVWMPLMKRWLTRRESPDRFKDSKNEYGTACALKVGDSVVKFLFQHSRALSGAEVLTLSRCEAQPFERFIESAVGRGQSRALIERLAQDDAGTVIVSGAPGKDFVRQIAVVLGLTGGGYLGDLSEEQVRLNLPHLSKSSRVVVSIAADDPTSALLEVRNFGINLSEISFKGCVSSTQVQKVCGGCAKKASVDSAIMAQIPEYLKTLSLEHYVVGRGCDVCGHRGYVGEVIIFSIVSATMNLATWFNAGSDQVELIKFLVPQGYRPLFEESYRRALDGETTIESVLKNNHLVPSVFCDYWTARKNVPQLEPRAPGEKTEIVFSESLLLNTSSTPVESGSEPLFPSERKNRVRREKPLVLVVEDDEDQRSILEMVLKSANYEVQQAANGAEALEAVQSEKPDIIISDLMMPIMDGSQMVSCLKQAPATSQVPILMLTMIADEEREYALLHLGADDYCEKTIQRKVLLQRVENLLRRSGTLQ